MKGIDEYLTDKQINEALDRMKVVCEDDEKCFDLLYELDLEGIKFPVSFINHWIRSEFSRELERLRFQDLGYGEKLKELGFDTYLEG